MICIVEGGLQLQIDVPSTPSTLFRMKDWTTRVIVTGPDRYDEF